MFVLGEDNALLISCMDVLRTWKMFTENDDIRQYPLRESMLRYDAASEKVQWWEEYSNERVQDGYIIQKAEG